MAIGVGEVDTPPAVVVVDLARAVAHRVRPVFKPSLVDAAENSVKIRFTGQEGLVLRPDRAFGVGEVQRDPVVEFHYVEMAEASRRRPTSISARNRADIVRSDDQTMVWLSRAAMPSSSSIAP
jgi:hypothetical protein